MSEKVTKKNTTAEATQKNAEAFEKALTAAKVEHTKREAKAVFNICGNIASVTAKSVRIFLKEEAFKAFEEYAKAYTKNAEAKRKEAKTEAQKKTADKAKQNAEAFEDSVKNASKDRKGPHTVAITVPAEAIQFSAVATAFKAYGDAKKQKKAEADEAKKQTAEKKNEADSKAKKNEAEKKDEEAKNAAK